MKVLFAASTARLKSWPDTKPKHSIQRMLLWSKYQPLRPDYVETPEFGSWEIKKQRYCWRFRAASDSGTGSPIARRTRSRREFGAE